MAKCKLCKEKKLKAGEAGICYKCYSSNQLVQQLHTDVTLMSEAKPYTIRGGEALKAAPPPPLIFCPHAFNFGATLLCVGDFSKKNSLTSCGEKTFLIGGHDLAVRGVSKYKVDMIFIIFREFNTMLETVNS